MGTTGVVYKKLNNIPETGVEERLGNLALYKKGKRPKNISIHKNDEYKYPYITIKGFEQGLFGEYSDGENGVMCTENDFLLVWDGARSGLVGKGMQGLVGSTLVKINIPGVYTEYAYYYLISKYHEINTNAKGTGIPHVNPDLLWNYLFPIPPIQEQHRIVEKIEELFSEIDKGVEYLQTAKEQLEVYRQAVLKAAFEGSLTLSWRQRQNIRNIGKALCDIKRPENEVIRMLAEIPDEWQYVYLSSLGELSRGKSRHRPRNDDRLFEDGIYPFIQTGEVKAARKYISQYSQTYNDFGLSQSKLWPKETLCITIAANIAETAFLGFDACFPDSIVGFVADDDKIAIEYIYYFFKYSQKRIEAYAPATAQKNINLTTLENIVVPYCSKEEQHQIVQEIESRLSAYQHVEEAIEKVLAQAETLKQSIFKKAFEGRLVPQDPDDEPAAILLERIRKGKKQEKAQKQ